MFGLTVIIIIVRLFTLQLVSSKYKTLADDQGTFRKVVYPDRGLIYDRKGRDKKDDLSDPMVRGGSLYGTGGAVA